MVKIMLQHFLVGAVAAVIFGGVLLWSDMAGLATLLAESPQREIGLVLLFAGLVSTFGPIAMLTGLASHSDEDDPPTR